MVKVRELPKELQEKAIKELYEDVGRIPEDIKSIKDWLKHKKYINARTDDQTILTFLRGCKFSLERTKEKIETFYTMKSILPEYFGNRDPFHPEIQAILKLGIFLPLPKPKDITHPRVIFMRGGIYDPAKFDIETIFKTNMMIQDIIMHEDDQTIICGTQMIQDTKGFTLAHMMSPMVAKKAMRVFQEAYPIRPKGMHMINIPPIFETMYAMIKPLLNEKMKSRMQIHRTDNLEELYKAVPQKMLPKEYGGEGPTLQHLTNEWKAKVESYSDWFKEDAKYGTNEKLRPGKPKTSHEYFGVLDAGMEGSFRKLNVD